MSTGPNDRTGWLPTVHETPDDQAEASPQVRAPLGWSVTYLRRDQPIATPGRAAFGVGTVIGEPTQDPDTDAVWVPIAPSDTDDPDSSPHRVDLIDTADVVDISPQSNSTSS